MSVLIAMTWGGVRFPWSSPHVLAPLIIGACGLVAFIAYEGRDAFSKIPAMIERWRWESKLRPLLVVADNELTPVRKAHGLPSDYGRSASGVLLLEPPANQSQNENEQKYWANVAGIRRRLADMLASQPYNPRWDGTRKNLTVRLVSILSMFLSI